MESRHWGLLIAQLMCIWALVWENTFSDDETRAQVVYFLNYIFKWFKFVFAETRLKKNRTPEKKTAYNIHTCTAARK